MLRGSFKEKHIISILLARTNYLGSVKFTVLFKKTGFAIKGVMTVVIKHIATQTENNVISSSIEYANAVIAKPTVPLPFNKVAIAKP